MKTRFAALALTLALLISLCGCGEIAGEIAGNVMDAAKQELENQIKQTFETYQVEILDMKSAVGKLNGDNSDIQFFCAVLVQSDSDAIPQAAADTLYKLFHDAGITVQTDADIRNAYLEHKDLSFKYDSFDAEKTYYCVWFYTDKLPSLEDLKELKKLLPTEALG